VLVPLSDERFFYTAFIYSVYTYNIHTNIGAMGMPVHIHTPIFLDLKKRKRNKEQGNNERNTYKH